MARRRAALTPCQHLEAVMRMTTQMNDHFVEFWREHPVLRTRFPVELGVWDELVRRLRGLTVTDLAERAVDNVNPITLHIVRMCDECLQNIILLLEADVSISERHRVKLNRTVGGAIMGLRTILLGNDGPDH